MALGDLDLHVGPLPGEMARTSCHLLVGTKRHMKPGRPRRYDNLVLLGARIPVDLRNRLNDAANARDLSAAYLVRRALEDYLSRLIPPDEIQWTTPDSVDPVGLAGSSGYLIGIVDPA